MKTVIQKQVALYARVSKADDSQTPENQLIKLRQVAQSRGLTVYDEYVDYASGADPNRPELERLLKDARDGKIGLILTVKVDRIARSMTNLHAMLQELECYDCKFQCVDQPEISTTSSMGKFMLNILGAFAEYEREVIRERTLAGLNRARLEGKVLGRPRKPINLSEVKAMLEAGLSLEEIAEKHDLSEATLRRRIKNGGLISPKETASKSSLSKTDDFATLG
ncbi:MAG: recombinase family protein [Thermoplasmata archaeon]